MKFFVLLLLLSRFSYAADETNLRAALDAHRWFDLRDSVIPGQAATIYRFFVAAAFNDVRGAEKELSAAIRSGVYRDRLAAMHYAMSRVYYRAGHCHKAEGEARRLGLRMIAGHALFDGITGKRSTNGHYAVANRLRIGNTELRNVAFTHCSAPLSYEDSIEVSSEYRGRT